MKLAPEITKEIEDMFNCIEGAKNELAKKFTSLMEEFTDTALQRFQDNIECNERYNYDRWIRDTCNSIVEGLLAGDTKWLKQQRIISEYTWEKLDAVRIAILKANGPEIENSVIKSQQEEIERLKKDVKFYREMSQRYS